MMLYFNLLIVSQALGCYLVAVALCCGNLLDVTAIHLASQKFCHLPFCAIPTRNFFNLLICMFPK